MSKTLVKDARVFYGTHPLHMSRFLRSYATIFDARHEVLSLALTALVFIFMVQKISNS
jgi:hypothetical protein